MRLDARNSKRARCREMSKDVRQCRGRAGQTRPRSSCCSGLIKPWLKPSARVFTNEINDGRFVLSRPKPAHAPSHQCGPGSTLTYHHARWNRAGASDSKATVVL